MQVKFSHREHETEEIISFYFEKPTGFRYTAGQFIEMTLPHSNPDERGIKHWFTLSTAPSDTLLSITTKQAPEHGSSFKRTLWQHKPGDLITLSNPMGDFVLPKDASIPLVFVAGGIGVTPFHSIIRELTNTKERRTIQLLYLAKTESELVFRELFENYGLEFIAVVGEKLNAKKIEIMAGGLLDKLIYLAGPEPMIETFVEQFKELSVKKDQLVTDYFPGYSAF